MIQYNDLRQIRDLEETVVALGNFDGVHKGHQELIRRAVDSAKAAGLKSAVFTFNNHPKNVLTGTTVVKNILYYEEKAKILDDMGIDYLISVDFDTTIQKLSAVDFIRKILVKCLRMREAYCGFNYRFGYHGEGNPEVLMRIGLKEGFGIHVLEPYKIQGTIVSSTLIRQYIADGDVAQCLSLMGHNYTVRGTVVQGHRLGKTIGFPTSNINLDDSMVTPADGVYITYCEYEGVKHPSITNVGLRPSVLEKKKTRNVETHMFNFNEDIYGKVIRVEFLDRIREEKHFNGIDELVAQIAKDCLTAAAYHGIVNCQ